VTAPVVVVGAGGREHALARRLAADPGAPRVVVVPGNDGIALEHECVAAPDDVDGLARTCADLAPGLVVIGPEAPLAAGLADRLAALGVTAFGPSAAAAQLESSKWFAKEVLREAGVPTAEAQRFDSAAAAIAALDTLGPPWVLKVDGLAAGKGVLVTADRAAAVEFARASLDGARFGAAGRALLLERFLAGDEVSVMAVCDGRDAVLLPAARDFKRAHDGDAGPNTGGMGAFAPALGPGLAAVVHERVVRPVLAALARRGTPFRGLLYCGLMLGARGPEVVEFNVRFGDPEAQVLLPLLDGALAPLLAAAARGRVADAPAPATRPGAVVAVALVDDAYPDAPSGAARIEGGTRVADVAGAWLLYGGVRADGPGAFRVTGGRAAYVCAQGDDVDEARGRAYAGIARLGGGGWRFRRDIATMVGAGPRRGTAGPGGA